MAWIALAIAVIPYNQDLKFLTYFCHTQDFHSQRPTVSTARSKLTTGGKISGHWPFYQMSEAANNFPWMWYLINLVQPSLKMQFLCKMGCSLTYLYFLLHSLYFVMPQRLILFFVRFYFYRNFYFPSKLSSTFVWYWLKFAVIVKSSFFCQGLTWNILIGISDGKFFIQHIFRITFCTKA